MNYINFGAGQGNRTLYLIVGNYYHSLKALYFNVYFKSNDHEITLTEMVL